MITLFSSAQSLYNQMIDEGVAKECARMVLPLCTPTKIYMTGSCRSWIHYIDLRSAHGTQKEHMDIAEACRKVFTEQFPTVSEALEWDLIFTKLKTPMPTYPVKNLKTGEQKEIQMSMTEYDQWRKDNPDWDKDWMQGVANVGEVGEVYDKLRKTHPGWNDVLHKASKAPGSKVRPV